MPYFNLRPDFITVLLHNNLARLQLLVIILNCVRISNRSHQAEDVKYEKLLRPALRPGKLVLFRVLKRKDVYLDLETWLMRIKWKLTKL